ncbi:MAG TPA: efflux RND transporter periplasmic adaptor subunit [Ignavibacteria bacterium]|nr:efflux RND transporter periplasmic adaptor subunit [Ignavibacteria bacterium]
MNRIIIVITTVLTVSVISFVIYKIFFQNDSKEILKSNELYVCPMHQQIRSDHPGVCPICNMDLVLKTSIENSEIDDSSSGVKKEIGEITISPAQQILANIHTETVKIKEYKKNLSFNGYIKTGENNMRHISTPVSGKIIKMYVNFEGQMVNKGDPAFEIYSPEIYSTEKEYILALQNYENVKESSYDLVKEQAEALIASTKTRLRLWEVTPSQIEELEQTKEARDHITVYSKYSGVITKKIDHEGHWAIAGEDVYDIVDMSTLWVIANVPESEINNIKLNQTAKITTVSYPGETFNAKINFISPMLNQETRTLEVRLDVLNRNYKLKPDMYVKIEIGSANYRWNIVIPRNAVLRTGKMDMVYIKKSQNVFSPKVVTIEGEMDGNYLITSGLSEGDEIVTSAGFLIDSESQIRHGTGLQNMEGMNMNKNEEPEFNKDQDIMKDMKK